MLHGKGEAGYFVNNGVSNNDDNEMQLKWGGKQHLDAVKNGKFQGFVLFPQEPYGSWTSGNPDDTSAANQLQQPYLGMMFELVELLSTQYKIDLNRVAVHGLSSGGTGTLAAVYHRPDLFAAALPMSAAATIGSWDNAATHANVRRNMGILAPVPIWWFQGGIDNNPPQTVTDIAIDYLRDSGAVNTDLSKYTVYPTSAHDVWNKAYAEPNFFPFILAQNKRKIYVMGNNPICCGVGTDLAFSKGFYQYQWFKDGVAIPGAIKHKLSNVTAGGVYTVQYVRRDNPAVLTSLPVTLSGGIANTPPAVNLTAPSNGSNYTAPASISLTASASDPGGSVAKVDFYQGATLLFSDVSAPYAYDWSNVVSGSYSLTAVATDNLGSSTTSSIVSVVVASNPAPTVSLTSPANNSNFVTPATISLAATASDPGGSVAKVDFYQGATLLFSDVSAPYAYDWTNVVAGSYSITAIATDNLGASATSIVSSVVVSNNIPPTVSLTAPSNNATYFSPATISLSATSSDIDGSVAKVDFYQGATLLFSDVSAPYSYDWSGVADGSYSLIVVATDNLGATATSSIITVTVNTPGGQTGTGLTAQYFNNKTLTGSPVVNGIDPTIDFMWPAAPASGVSSDNFSVRWAGKLQPDYSQVYTFYVKADDGERLYINGNLVTNDFTDHASREKSGTVSMVAGQQYDIVLEFYDACCAADVKLSWSSTSVPKQVIPQINLYPVGAPINLLPTVSLATPSTGSAYLAPANINLSAVASDLDGSITKVDFYQGTTLLYSDLSAPYSYDWAGVDPGSYSLSAIATDNLGASTTSTLVAVVVNSGGGPIGTGLTAQFFNNKTLAGSPVVTRVDATVDFTWPAAPTTGVTPDNFSARWSGKIQSDYSQVFTFYVKSDDGERLYVNGNLVTNDFVDHASRERSGTVSMVAGQQYDIVLEFYDACCAADVKLSWSSASVSKQVVPQLNLFPAVSTREDEYDSYMESFSYVSTTAFPQPTSEILNLAYNGTSSANVEITLMDNLSQIRMNQTHFVKKGNNVLTFDVSDMSPGIYMMTIRSDEKMETIKVVIE